MATTARVSCAPTCEAPTHSRPRRTRPRRSGTPGSREVDIAADSRAGRRESSLYGRPGYGDGRPTTVTSMCGIAGAFRLDGMADCRALPEDVLRAMTDIIDYRGPDDAGYVSGDGASLGARRLSIIDVEGGHQPFSDERGRIWAAQNGEIYNHDALREELRARGHVLRSRCDTEVLPHLFEEHGPALAERLRGMFAVAVWDGRDAPRRPDPRPARHQAALLRDHARPRRLRLRAEVHPGQRPRQRRARPRGHLRLPDARLRPRRDDAAARRPQAACPASASWSRTGACASSAGGTTPRPTRCATAAPPRSGRRSCSTSSTSPSGCGS